MIVHIITAITYLLFFFFGFFGFMFSIFILQTLCTQVKKTFLKNHAMGIRYMCICVKVLFFQMHTKPGTKNEHEPI